MNFDSELLKSIREYLQYSESYVAQKIDVTVQCLNDVESGSSSIPKSLINFYAKSLRVYPPFLHAVLVSSKNNIKERSVNKLLRKYFGLIIELRKYEKNKSYKINQSPFYKLMSHKKLAACLGFKDEKTLRGILKRGDDNYYQSKLPGGREIEVPLNQLNRVHRRINKLLTRIEVPDYLNSGVKGRSNVKNARDHVGKLSVLKLDIKKFYPSVTYDQIYRCFVKSFSCSKDVAETLAKLCSFKGHLPTGSSISQSLSFLVNRPVFDHINTYSKARKIRFTVYVDDLSFSGKLIPKEFCSYITSYLKKNRGYTCHKIRIYKTLTPKSITGAVVVGDVLKVRNRHRKRIQKLLHIYNFMVERYQPDDYQLINYFQRLQGHLYSAAQINPRYRQMGDIIVERRCKLGVPALNQNTKNQKNQA